MAASPQVLVTVLYWGLLYSPGTLLAQDLSTVNTHLLAWAFNGDFFFMSVAFNKL